ncbi:UTRA domain-containing protein [Spirosoma areae]
MSDLNFENRSLFELLRTVYNLIVQGGEQKLLATTATENLTQLLAVPPASSVLRLDKRVDTNNNDFSYYSSLYARTDHFLLHGRF